MTYSRSTYSFRKFTTALVVCAAAAAGALALSPSQAGAAPSDRSSSQAKTAAFWSPKPVSCYRYKGKTICSVCGRNGCSGSIG